MKVKIGLPVSVGLVMNVSSLLTLSKVVYILIQIRPTQPDITLHDLRQLRFSHVQLYKGIHMKFLRTHLVEMKKELRKLKRKVRK